MLACITDLVDVALHSTACHSCNQRCVLYAACKRVGSVPRESMVLPASIVSPAAEIRRTGQPGAGTVQSNWYLHCARITVINYFTFIRLYPSIHPSFITPKQQNIKAHKTKAHSNTNQKIKHKTIQESRAAARKQRDAASILFGRSSPTTFLTSIRLAMLRKPRFRAPNMLVQNTI